MNKIILLLGFLVLNGCGSDCADSSAPDHEKMECSQGAFIYHEGALVLCRCQAEKPTTIQITLAK